MVDPKCPICGKPAAAKITPFCSPRCADIDLGRWFTGQYAVPAAPDADESEGALDQADEDA
jgi:endogenous inhibitor of DNA gyrase (YacG/DUF329 family)